VQVAKQTVGKKYINRGNTNNIFHHAIKQHQILKLYLVVQNYSIHICSFTNCRRLWRTSHGPTITIV